MSQFDSCRRGWRERLCQPACKPGSVWPPRLPAGTWRPFLWDIRCRMPRCDLPGRLARKQAGGVTRRVVPIRSCSRWGLPCRCRCRRARWALTPPFHPCRGMPRRFLFCGTVPQVRQISLPGRMLSGIVFPWSPDFPPTPPFGDRVSGHPAGWHVSLKDGDDPRQANPPRRNFGAFASMVNHRLAWLR